MPGKMWKLVGRLSVPERARTRLQREKKMGKGGAEQGRAGQGRTVLGWEDE